MDTGVYILRRNKLDYVLACEVQSRVTDALRQTVARRSEAMIVPVTIETIKPIFSKEEIIKLGGRPAATFAGEMFSTK